MGVKWKMKTISFGNIVPLLNQGSCDAYIGGISDTPERRKIERFADYGQFGEMFLVEKGNPKHVMGYESLSGLTVATTVGTVDEMFLKAADTKFKKQGKPGIKIRLFTSATSPVQALIGGQIDVVIGGYTSAVGFRKKFPDKLEFALPRQVNVLPAGIASKMSDPALNRAFAKAIAVMYRDGSMMKILKKWDIELTALTHPPK